MTDLACGTFDGALPGLRSLTSHLGSLLHSALRLFHGAIRSSASDEVPVSTGISRPDGEAVHVKGCDDAETEHHVGEAVPSVSLVSPIAMSHVGHRKL